MERKLQKSLVGACGVFHVSAELSRRGWVAMPTIRNTRGIDKVAAKDDKVANIQVKTNSYGKIRYPMNSKDEDAIAGSVYEVFVTLKGEKERPDFYIFRSQFVAEYIKRTHEKWKTMEPRHKRGSYEKITKAGIVQRRERSAFRRFPNYVGKLLPQFKDFEIDNYRDKWEILGQ